MSHNIFVAKNLKIEELCFMQSDEIFEFYSGRFHGGIAIIIKTGA
jgi:hypothetical protein